MTRRRSGNLRRMTRYERILKAERNEKRNRVSKAVRWQKEHEVKEQKDVRKGLRLRSKRKIAEAALAEAIKEQVPAVEDAKSKKG